MALWGHNNVFCYAEGKITVCQTVSKKYNIKMNKKNYEGPVLTTNLITTASSVYQDSTGTTDRSGFRRFRKTLLSMRLVVTCTKVTIGLPHFTGLKEVHRQFLFFILTVQMKLEKLNHCWNEKGEILTSLGSPVGPLQTGGKKEKSNTFLCIRI